MMSLFSSRKPKRGRYDFEVAQGAENSSVQNAAGMSAQAFSDFLRGGMAAGVAVNEKTAMSVSAVYACVSLIGGAIASLPLPIYQRTETGREKVSHPIWWYLNEQPHVDYSAAIFWEAMIASLLLHGDAFALIKRARPMTGAIVGFEWVPSRNVTVKKDEQLGVVYVCTKDSGKPDTVLAAEMLHIAGPGFNGLRGMSQIQYVLRNPAGIAIAADQYSAGFFENGARPDFALVHPGNVSEDTAKILRSTWADRHSGFKNAHLPAILSGGMDVKELTMNAEDSQLIATRQFQVEDVARIFGVPPHMIGHTEKTTSWGSGVEQMSIAFVKYTLMRHLRKIEQELNRKIWPSREKYFAEFNTSGLERGDYKTRNEGYRIALGRAGEPGWMTTNEIRKLENLPPIDGGDSLNDGGTDNVAATA